MGLLIAVLVLPVLFAAVATYVLLRVALLFLRLVFAPALALRRH